MRSNTQRRHLTTSLYYAYQVVVVSLYWKWTGPIYQDPHDSAVVRDKRRKKTGNRLTPPTPIVTSDDDTSTEKEDTSINFDVVTGVIVEHFGETRLTESVGTNIRFQFPFY